MGNNEEAADTMIESAKGKQNSTKTKQNSTKEGEYFDSLVLFMKDKILTTLSIVFVTFSILSNDSTNHVSIKQLIYILLGMAIFFLVSGLFELVYKIILHGTNHNYADIIIAFITCFMYSVLLYVTIIYIVLQYKIINKKKFKSKID